MGSTVHHSKLSCNASRRAQNDGMVAKDNATSMHNNIPTQPGRSGDLDRISQAALRGPSSHSGAESSSSRNGESQGVAPDATSAAFRPNSKMFGANAPQGLPPTSDYGFAQPDMHDTAFQSGLMPGAPVSSIDNGLDMPEGVNPSFEGDAQDQLGINGAGDDVSRQRERNR